MAFVPLVFLMIAFSWVCAAETLEEGLPFVFYTRMEIPLDNIVGAELYDAASKSSFTLTCFLHEDTLIKLSRFAGGVKYVELCSSSGVKLPPEVAHGRFYDITLNTLVTDETKTLIQNTLVLRSIHIMSNQVAVPFSKSTLPKQVFVLPTWESVPVTLGDKETPLMLNEGQSIIIPIIGSFWNVAAKIWLVDDLHVFSRVPNIKSQRMLQCNDANEVPYFRSLGETRSLLLLCIRSGIANLQTWPQKLYAELPADMVLDLDFYVKRGYGDQRTVTVYDKSTITLEGFPGLTQIHESHMDQAGKLPVGSPLIKPKVKRVFLVKSRERHEMRCFDSHDLLFKWKDASDSSISLDICLHSGIRTPYGIQYEIPYNIVLEVESASGETKDWIWNGKILFKQRIRNSNKHTVSITMKETSVFYRSGQTISEWIYADTKFFPLRGGVTVALRINNHPELDAISAVKVVSDTSEDTKELKCLNHTDKLAEFIQSNFIGLVELFLCPRSGLAPLNTEPGKIPFRLILESPKYVFETDIKVYI